MDLIENYISRMIVQKASDMKILRRVFGMVVVETKGCTWGMNEEVYEAIVKRLQNANEKKN